jgi:Transposase IS200 like
VDVVVRNFVGQHFWARGYFVSTVGRGEAVIGEYIRKQEQRSLKNSSQRLLVKFFPRKKQCRKSRRRFRQLRLS